MQQASSASSQWHSLHSRITSSSSSLKSSNKRRRISFVPSSGSSSPGSLSHSRPANKTENKKKKELFPEATVREYLVWRAVRRAGPGLMNHGNTCFLNSVLQCLLAVAPFSQVLLHESELALRGLRDRDGRNNSSISLLYQRLVAQVFSTSAGNKSISPRGMINSIRRVGKQFRPHRQEDAHEYLRQLLDTMHEEVLKACNIKISQGDIAQTTLISKVFGGYMRNELKGLKCGHTSQTYNHFQDLSLEISQGVSSVDVAFDAFMKAEKLGKGNEWFCEKCKKKVQATKQLTISTPPITLVLHLKRFSFGGMSDKIKKHISFPVQLRCPVSEGNKSTTKYDLCGIVVHHGYSTHNGHYIAYIKSSSGQWYEMDDSSVSMTNVKNVLRQQAYLLFYTQVPSADPVVKKMVTPQPEQVNVIEQPKSTCLDMGEELPPTKLVKTPVTLVNENSKTDVNLINQSVNNSPKYVKMPEKNRIVVESYPIELITRLPSRTCRGMFYFKGPIGKLHQYRHFRSSKHYENRSLLHSDEDENDDNDDDANSSFKGHFDTGATPEIDQSEDSSDVESDSSSLKIDSVESTEIDSNRNEYTTASRQQLIQMSMRGRDVGGEGVWQSELSSDVVSSQLQQHIEATQKRLRRLEQKEQSKKRPSQWDEMLDSGRQKKVKQGNKEEMLFDGVNEFQKLQDSVTSKANGSSGGKMDTFMQNMHHEYKFLNKGSRDNNDNNAEDIDDDDKGLIWDKNRSDGEDRMEAERNSLMNFTKDRKEDRDTQRKISHFHKGGKGNINSGNKGGMSSRNGFGAYGAKGGKRGGGGGGKFGGGRGGRGGKGGKGSTGKFGGGRGGKR